MKEAQSPHFASVQELRVGMFVHLDGGWLAHPFPLSNFKIASNDQVDTLRSLGLERIRWSPTKSDPLPVPQALARPAEPVLRLASVRPGAAGSAAAPSTSIESPKETARRLRRAALAAQREALQHCERQFAEATHACKTISELVTLKPQAAREQSEALSRALVDKMLGEEETCIRLLGEYAGDKASLHAVNVTVISLLMGKAFGLDVAGMTDLGVGSLLHDIGKLDLPERLRHREEHFSPSEVRAYEDHVAHGIAHARRMGLSPGATLVVAQHHEHVDGSGFPLRLASDRLSIGSRIVALVNRYDNLCNPNLPARALTPHEALSFLFAQGKNQFDAALLSGFIKMMGVYPPGSTVQLTDDRYAMVLSVNSSRPLKPRVLVHDRDVPANEALVLNLEAEPRLGIRRSIRPLALPREALEYLSPRPRMAYFFEPARVHEAETVT
jgi:HD-GYP domain-containing protein (c-di-GMP phosphodiesterase class II)